MIFVRDKGRMCNNILQYAHVYAWAREHGRKTMSMRFAYKYPYFHLCDTPWHNFATYTFAKYGAKWGLIPVVSFHQEEADTTAQEQAMLAKKLIVAEGWYARWYDLFLKYKDEILQLFAFHPNIEKHAQQVTADSEGLIPVTEDVKTGKSRFIPAQYLVLSLGVRPTGRLARDLDELSVRRIWRVGDAVKSGTIADACHSAFDAVMSIR